MSEHSTKPSNVDDEIDLSVVFKAIQNFFKKILIGIVSIFSFYWRHKFILLGLIVVGAVLGYFWENNFDKTYKNQLLVLPNFDSTNYLYNKIESIESKINTGDTIFLKEIFGKEYEFVVSVEINPVVDIYNFVSKNESNKDLFELLFEEEANMEFLENPINSMNYEYHNISFSVLGEEHHQKLSKFLLQHLNSNTHFEAIKAISLDNLEYQLEANQYMIGQIDSVVKFAQNRKSIELDNNALSFNDNTGINDLLMMKKDLITQKRFINEKMIEENEIIKLVDVNNKIIDDSSVLNKSKIKLFPVLFILMYSLVFLMAYFIKSTKNITS